jgi:hypothetical protein
MRPIKVRPKKEREREKKLQGGSNMTGTDFVLLFAHHSSNSQTGLNRF